MFSVFAGYLYCFCLCCLHSWYLLFDFCSFALAVLCGEHLCIIQLYMAHRWVCGLLVCFCFYFHHTYRTYETLHRSKESRVLLHFNEILKIVNNVNNFIRINITVDSLFYVSLAEKGMCISTVSLWILLVYTEASLRLKDLKTSHANLSHLFAAHW